MRLFKLLEKNQKNADYHSSDDYRFYFEHRHLFNSLEMYRSLLDVSNEFDLMRANIIIQSLINKKTIEDSVIYVYKKSMMNTLEANKVIEESIKKLPYIIEGEEKIYVPIFSRAINTFYSRQFAKLLSEPYNKLLENFDVSCIDLFEVYNFELYDSLFSKLVPIYKDENVMVTYHFDFHSIYVINKQGRLDAKIALFDRYLKKPNYDHVIERIKPVVDRYLHDDKEGMMKLLIEKNLVSEKLIYKYKHDEFKLKRSLGRKAK